MSVFLILTGTLPAVSKQQTTSEKTPDMRRSVQELIQKELRQNLKGWEGILFYCGPDSSSRDVVKKICEITHTNAAFLAGTANINLVKAENAYKLGWGSGGMLGDLLILEVQVSTTTGDSPAAVHAAVRGYVSYDQVVEPKGSLKERVELDQRIAEARKALPERTIPGPDAKPMINPDYAKALKRLKKDTESWKVDMKGPKSMPRSGDLIFWERNVIGASSGSGEDLVQGMADGIEQILKQFFTEYVNAQR